MPSVQIRRSTLVSPDAVRLIAALNLELTGTFPEPGATHFSLSDAHVAPGEGAFLIAYLDGVAVGCGAVRRLDDATAELKRMYVEPSVRGQGIGRSLVEALEHEARLLGVMRLVLETGTRLAPAIRMYQAMGYVRIPLFGEYLSSPNTSPRRIPVCVSVNRSLDRGSIAGGRAQGTDQPGPSRRNLRFTIAYSELIWPYNISPFAAEGVILNGAGGVVKNPENF